MRPLAQPEGFKEILQPVMHEDDLGLFQCSVGAARAHGDPHMRGREAGGIIDAVAHHHHAFSAGAKIPDGGHLVLGPEFRANIIQRQLRPEMLRGGLAVPGKNNGLKAGGPHVLEHGFGLRTDFVAQQDAAQQIPGADPHLRIHNPGGRHAREDRGLRPVFQGIAAAEIHLFSIISGAQALAGNGFEITDVDGGQLLLFAVAGDRAGERVRGEALQRIRQPGHLSLVARWKVSIFPP